MSLEEEKNKALVRRFWEAVAKGDIDAIDELLAADFVDHSTLAGQEPGREGYKQQVAEQHAALSDVRSTIVGHQREAPWRDTANRATYGRQYTKL